MFFYQYRVGVKADFQDAISVNVQLVQQGWTRLASLLGKMLGGQLRPQVEVIATIQQVLIDSYEKAHQRNDAMDLIPFPPACALHYHHITMQY